MWICHHFVECVCRTNEWLTNRLTKENVQLKFSQTWNEVKYFDTPKLNPNEELRANIFIEKMRHQMTKWNLHTQKHKIRSFHIPNGQTHITVLCKWVREEWKITGKINKQWICCDVFSLLLVCRQFCTKCMRFHLNLVKIRNK